MLHASQSHLAANSRSFSHLHCLQQVAWRTVVDVDPSLGGHHATLASPVQNSLRYQDDPRHLHPRPTDGMQNAAAAALEEAFLDPAVDTPPKRSLSSTAKAIHFLAICRTFRSGGTRIRTGDTMIFSHTQKPLGMRNTRIGKRIYVHGVPSDTTWLCPYCCATVDTAFARAIGPVPLECGYAYANQQPTVQSTRKP